MFTQMLSQVSTRCMTPHNVVVSTDFHTSHQTRSTVFYTAEIKIKTFYNLLTEKTLAVY